MLDSTAAAFPKDPTAADNATASATFKSAIKSIDGLIVAATSDVKGLHKRDTVMIKRQDPTTGLPAELALIIEEIGGALTEIIATLGLSESISRDASDAIAMLIRLQLPRSPSLAHWLHRSAGCWLR